MGLSMWLIYPPSLKVGRQRIASRHPSASILMKAFPCGWRDEVQKEWEAEAGFWSYLCHLWLRGPLSPQITDTFWEKKGVRPSSFWESMIHRPPSWCAPASRAPGSHPRLAILLKPSWPSRNSASCLLHLENVFIWSPCSQLETLLTVGDPAHSWRRKWQPTPVFLPREFCGQRSLVGCCP